MFEGKILPGTRSIFFPEVSEMSPGGDLLVLAVE